MQRILQFDNCREKYQLWLVNSYPVLSMESKVNFFVLKQEIISWKHKILTYIESGDDQIVRTSHLERKYPCSKMSLTNMKLNIVAYSVNWNLPNKKIVNLGKQSPTFASNFETYTPGFLPYQISR